MIKAFKLLLPILLPSWQFFKEIAPSPRIEFNISKLSENHESNQETWQEFRPRPKSIPIKKILLNLIYNPTWNENMYLVNLAESLIIDSDNNYAEAEIIDRIAKDLMRKNQKNSGGYLKFRLVFIFRENEVLKKEILYHSKSTHLIEEKLHG